MNIDEESPRRRRRRRPPLPSGTSGTRESAFSAGASVARGHLYGCMSPGDKWRRAQRVDRSSISASKQLPLLNLICWQMHELFARNSSL